MNDHNVHIRCGNWIDGNHFWLVLYDVHDSTRDSVEFATQTNTEPDLIKLFQYINQLNYFSIRFSPSLFFFASGSTPQPQISTMKLQLVFVSNSKLSATSATCILHINQLYKLDFTALFSFNFRFASRLSDFRMGKIEMKQQEIEPHNEFCQKCFVPK